MTFEAYMARCNAIYESNKYLRWGQVLYTELVFHNPKLADTLLGTPADPFYDNRNVSTFLSVVHNYWLSFGSVTDDRD